MYHLFIFSNKIIKYFFIHELKFFYPLKKFIKYLYRKLFTLTLIIN